MFLITSERESSISGKIENRLFGVRLETQKNIPDTLKEAGLEELIESKVAYNLFRDILKENLKDELFWKGRLIDAESRFKNEQSFEWPFLSEKVLNYLHFDCLSKICGTDKEILLSLAKKYFDGVKRAPRRLSIFYSIVEHLDAFQLMDYKLVQSTEENIVLGKRCKSYKPFFGCIPTARYNTLVLMFLTGKTTFVNLRGQEEPIILDGSARTIPNWVELPYDEDDYKLKYVRK